MKNTRTIATLLRAGMPLVAALESGEKYRVLAEAGQLAQVAGQVANTLHGTISNNVFEQNRIYRDGITEHLVECCEGLIGCHRAMLSANGRDDAVFWQAVQHLFAYYGLVGEATSGQGMSPHALVGIPPGVSCDGGSSGEAGFGGFGFDIMLKEELHVITDGCADVLDLSCVEACPVDCIYIGDSMAYIHPNECIQCGQCAAACPVGAIFAISDLPQDLQHFAGINSQYFELPHIQSGSPGGAAFLGRSGVDHPGIHLPTPTPETAPTAPEVETRPSKKTQGVSKELPTKITKTAPKKSAKTAAKKSPSGSTKKTAAKRVSKPNEMRPEKDLVQRSGIIDVTVIPKSNLNLSARRLIKRDRLESVSEVLVSLRTFYGVEPGDNRAMKVLDEAAERAWEGHVHAAEQEARNRPSGCLSTVMVVLAASVAAALLAFSDFALASVR